MLRDRVVHVPTAVASAFALLAVVPPSWAQCPASQTRYDVVDLGTLGGNFSSAVDLDDAGRVVGAARTAAGSVHPFLWENGVMHDLGTLGGAFASAGGINEAGEITGQSDNSLGVRRAFFYANGGMTEIPPLVDGSEGRGFDINDLGQVVGIAPAANGQQQGFLYDADTGALTGLGVAAAGDNASTANAINASGQIAAWSGPVFNPPVGAMGYLLDGGTWTPLGTLGGSRSVAYGLDDSGRVVGWSDISGDSATHAFLWAGGLMIDLGTLGGLNSAASSAHASGPVVGWSDRAAGHQHAFVYAGGEMADLNALIAPDTVLELELAVAVNARGQVAGRGFIGNDMHAYLATPASTTIDEAADLVAGFSLPGGIENSLLAKLSSARAALAGCSPGVACGPLGALVHQIGAQSGKQIPKAQADQLLAEILAIETTIGCP